jgi:hypothetical protein
MAETTRGPGRPPIERTPPDPTHDEPAKLAEEKPAPLSKAERERFDELSSKTPNPNVLPPSVRTEAEEQEFRRLQKRVSDADRVAALEAARPEARLTPTQRLAVLKKTDQHGEGVEIETRRLEYLIRDEKRVAELEAMDKRVVEEDEELAMLRQRVREARANGGFDAND